MSVRARLRSGELLLSGWSAVPEPLISEMVARQGFDVVTLDMQHGGHDEASVLRSVGPISAAGAACAVRVPVGRFDLASRVLDMGAQIIIAPMINSLEDARRLAAVAKYPPVGERSWGPFRARIPGSTQSAGEYLRDANESTICLAMIETRAGLGVAEDILALDGIDGVLVGPADLSIDWTEGSSVDPALDEMMAEIARIAAAATGRGKIAAIYSADPVYAGRYAAMGFSLIALGDEAAYMSQGARNIIAAARGNIGA